MLKQIEKRIKSCEPVKICFWFLTIFIFFGFFSYGYLVRGTIVNIVNRQNMEKELSLTNARLINLESEYIKAKNTVTMERATELGFVPASSKKFVIKNIKKPGLSLLTSGN